MIPDHFGDGLGPILGSFGALSAPARPELTLFHANNGAGHLGKENRRKDLPAQVVEHSFTSPFFF